MSVPTVNRATPAESPGRQSRATVRRRWVRPGRTVARDTAAILQLRDDVPAGLLMDVLDHHGLRAGTVRVDRDERCPTRARWPPRSCSARQLGRLQPRQSLAHTELEWIRQADRAGMPVLGLGSGATRWPRARRRRRAGAPSGAGAGSASRHAPDVIVRGPAGVERRPIELPPGAELLAHDRVARRRSRSAGIWGRSSIPRSGPRPLPAGLAFGAARPSTAGRWTGRRYSRRPRASSLPRWQRRHGCFRRSSTLRSVGPVKKAGGSAHARVGAVGHRRARPDRDLGAGIVELVRRSASRAGRWGDVRRMDRLERPGHGR